MVEYFKDMGTYIWMLLSGALCIITGILTRIITTPGGAVDQLDIDQVLMVIGSVIVGAGIGGLQLANFVRSMKAELEQGINQTLEDHVGASHYDRPIPKAYRKKIYLYHQSSPKTKNNDEIAQWRVIPYDFSKDSSKKRVKAICDVRNESPGFEDGIQYEAELLLKKHKIVIYVTNPDPDETVESTGVFLFDTRTNKAPLYGFLHHHDMDPKIQKLRISRAILAVRPIDGHVVAVDKGEKDSIDDEKLNKLWEEGSPNYIITIDNKSESAPTHNPSIDPNISPSTQAVIDDIGKKKGDMT